MPLELVRNDIVKMATDVIVNAANGQLRPGGGVCGAIFSAAGYEKLDRACRAIGHCDTGGAVITRGYDLPAKYIIHAVGPVWQGGDSGEAEQLRSCYIAALELARRKGCRSIAFPLISSGIYGYPKAQALRIAVGAISDFLLDNEMQVYLVIFDSGSMLLGEKLFANIRSYIDDVYVEASPYARRERYEPLMEREEACRAADFSVSPVMASIPPPPEKKQRPGAIAPKRAQRSLDDVVSQLDESFSRRLLRLIDEKGMTDVEVYKRANIDRKLFSKIRKDNGYTPSKPTALALAIALRLTLDETRDLLSRAGYALSRSSRSDVIIEYFIREGEYDIFSINEALFAFGERTLGAA